MYIYIYVYIYIMYIYICIYIYHLYHLFGIIYSEKYFHFCTLNMISQARKNEKYSWGRGCEL